MTLSCFYRWVLPSKSFCSLLLAAKPALAWVYRVLIMRQALVHLPRGFRAWHALVRRRGRLERFRDGSRVYKHTPSVWDTGKEISMQAADWALRKGGLPGPLRVSRGPSGPIGTRGFPAEHCWEVGLVQCPLT